MSQTKLVAIDLAKNCYQVAGFTGGGKLQYNRKYSAAKFAMAMQQLEPTVLGHQVRLVPAQHAKAFRRVHKSDGHDVISITSRAGVSGTGDNDAGCCLLAD